MCFLIVSCDLPSDKNNSYCPELSTLDDCGICCEGDTGIIFNENKDNCGRCFGNEFGICAKCGDSNAIQSYDCALEVNTCDECEDDCSNCSYLCCECEFVFEHNIDSCNYNLCEDYHENMNYSCELSGVDSPYNIGDQLSCDVVQEEFSFCYPACENIDNTFKLADFEGKNILIVYEEDW